MVTGEVLTSFIIPIYNAEKYLNRCLSSIVAMKNNDIEIIIVDDGSTDDSASIYEKYKAADSRISVVKKKNGGVSSARNRGILTARGEWIAFIDGDDEIVPMVYDSCLVQLDQRFELYMLGMGSRDAGCIDTEKKVVQGVWSGKDIEGIKKGIFNPDTKFAKRVKSQGISLNSPWCKFYQKRIIVENNIFFHENLSIGEDCVFNFIYLNYVNSISYTNKCAYYYWINPDSVMHKFVSGKGRQFLVTLEEVYDLLKGAYSLEYAQFGVRQYLYALKSEWCTINNRDSYDIRKKNAMKWREKDLVQKAFDHFKLSQIRWEAVPVAFCGKMKWFLLCDLMLKTKEKLPIKFK